MEPVYSYATRLIVIANSRHDTRPEGYFGHLVLRTGTVDVPSELVDKVMNYVKRECPREKFIQSKSFVPGYVNVKVK